MEKYLDNHYKSIVAYTLVALLLILSAVLLHNGVYQYFGQSAPVDTTRESGDMATDNTTDEEREAFLERVREERENDPAVTDEEREAFLERVQQERQEDV